MSGAQYIPKPTDNSKDWLHPYAPLIALDLDGTVADYYNHFKWFAELYLQRKLTADWDSTTEFSEALGLEKRVYRDIKLAYRQGGMKRSIPLQDPFCHRLADRIRELGVQVWVTTTRPWERLDNIDPDTKFWIDRNLGRVDGLLYGEDKYRDLMAILNPQEYRILGVFDDLPENVNRARQLGLQAALRIGPHNRGRRDGLTVANGDGIFERTRSWMHNYKMEESVA